jgi:hypothetical protein
MSTFKLYGISAAITFLLLLVLTILSGGGFVFALFYINVLTLQLIIPNMTDDNAMGLALLFFIIEIVLSPTILFGVCKLFISKPK